MASPQLSPSARAPVVDRGTRSFIDSHPESVRPDSSLYIYRHSTQDTKGQESHFLVGVHVVFNPKAENELWTAFNIDRNSQKLDPSSPKVRVKSLLVACDTLVIHGELSLPECDVKIYARRVVFKDNGAINTSPLAWTVKRAQDADTSPKKVGENGAEGRNAGSISVFIDEMEVPEHESRKRFIARGGSGQDAGLGANGKDGESMPPIYRFQERFVSSSTPGAGEFNPPAVFYECSWWVGLRWGARVQKGIDGWPNSGTDALPPGVPGNAGNGGAFKSNRRDLISQLDNAGGNAGKQASNVTGGKAGTPRKCAHYELAITADIDPKHPFQRGLGTAIDCKKKEERETSDGKSYDAGLATRIRGETPSAVTVDLTNGWIHPLQLQAVLSYARDAFLAGQRTEVSGFLQTYMRALALEPPATEATEVWNESNEAQWNSAQTEIATLLFRLQRQLDYFGNPAGYTPQLSLQSTMRLYDIESKSALRVLLLARWVTDKSNAALSASTAIKETIDSLNEETSKVAEEMGKAADKVKSINRTIDSVEGRLTSLTTDLKALETKLFNEAAAKEERKREIQALIKIGGAILQVIPVGQPVLGTIGKLAGVVAPAVAEIPNEGLGKSLGKMKEALGKAKEVTTKSKEEEDPKKKASAWAKVGKGLGPALSQAGDGINTLQVPKEEVEAELEKLKAQSADWKKLGEEIEQFNEQKAALFAELSEALQTVGDGYSRLAGNAQSVSTLDKERNATLEKVDPQATLAVVQFAQRARIALVHSLYVMVKAYETRVFKPIRVDWQLTNVFDKIATLLKPNKGFTAKDLKDYADVLEPLFRGNLDTVKKALQKNYDFKEKNESLEFGFAATGTPDQLGALNTRGELTLSPLEYGLILPTRQRVSITKFELKTLEFDPNGPALPSKGNVIISLRVSSDGAIRVGERLYAVRSDAPFIWSWTYHFSDKSVDPSVPSLASLDLLNSILETSDKAIKEKLANPPAWSDFLLGVDFPQDLEERPRIEKLLFKMYCDYVQPPTDQRVLDIRSIGTSARIKCLPPDLGDRAAGSGTLYRIYNRGQEVTLEAPEAVDAMQFSRWDVLGKSQQKRVENRTTKAKLDDHLLVRCRYEPTVARATETSKPLTTAQKKAILASVKKGDKDTVLLFLESVPRATDAEAGKTIQSARPRLLRLGAGERYLPIGEVLEGETPTILERAVKPGGWDKVLYRGMVAYVQS